MKKKQKHAKPRSRKRYNKPNKRSQRRANPAFVMPSSTVAIDSLDSIVANMYVQSALVGLRPEVKMFIGAVIDSFRPILEKAHAANIQSANAVQSQPVENSEKSANNKEGNNS